MADLTQIWDMPNDSKSTISWGATLTARSGRSAAASTGGLSLGGGVNRAANEARRRERKQAKLRLIKQRTRNVYSESAKDFRPRGLDRSIPSGSAFRGGGNGSVSTYDMTDSLAHLSESTGRRKTAMIQSRKKAQGIIRTPLMQAAAKGDVEEVRALMEARVDLFEEDHKGRTALDWARVALLPECKACAKVRGWPA